MLLKRINQQKEIIGLTPSRIEGLTDGVFAIAMTLLVLNIEINIIFKGSQWEILKDMLTEIFPQILNYVISFLILGFFWILHHKQFHFIKHVTTKILWLNNFSLLLIALVPFTTSLLDNHNDLIVAAFLFNLNMFAISSVFLLQWHYISKNEHLIDNTKEGFNLKYSIKKGSVMPIVSLLAMGLSFIIPGWSTVIYILIPIIIKLL